jgi:hypothetical protein
MPVWLKMLVFMLCLAGIMKSKTTYTANLIVSDSARVIHTRTDSLVTDRLRVTDTICTDLNISIQDTGSQTSENYKGLHTLQVRGDRQTTILTSGMNAPLSA